MTNAMVPIAPENPQERRFERPLPSGASGPRGLAIATDTRRRILLVEAPSLGVGTFHSLVQLAHNPVLATSAPSAYHFLCKPHKFGLILLDLQPGDRGWELVAQKLRNDGVALPPVVIHSSQPDNDLRRLAEAMGARGFLRKPSSLQMMHRVIEQAFDDGHEETSRNG